MFVGVTIVGADDLIDRNRRLLALAEDTRALTRQVAVQTAETRLMADVTPLRTVHLHYGRTGLLSEMIYRRCAIADEMVTHSLKSGVCTCGIAVRTLARHL